MIFSTTPEIPGFEVETNLGVVSGNVVQSKHLVRDFMAGLRGIIGGEVKGYTELYADSREMAMNRMLAEAEKLHADAVINIRFSTSAIMTNASEILVYGTAVKLKPASAANQTPDTAGQADADDTTTELNRTKISPFPS